MASRGAKLVKDSGITETIEVLISGLTVAVGDILELDVGSTTWTLASSATETWQKKIVATQSRDTNDTLLVGIKVTEGQSWDISCANASSADDNGDSMVLTDEDAINNSGTNSAGKEAVVIQLAPIGATTENRALFRFMDCSGYNPDAS